MKYYIVRNFIKFFDSVVSNSSNILDFYETVAIDFLMLPICNINRKQYDA